MNMIQYLSVGKNIRLYLSIFGVGLFAIPAGLLTSGLSDETKTAKKTVRIAEKISRVFFTKIAF